MHHSNPLAVSARQQTARRATPRPLGRHDGGFTLLELALASTLIVGVSVGMLLSLRMHHMVQLGEAAGEQLNLIDAGVNRYMQQHAQAIAGLPATCAVIPALDTASVPDPQCAMPANGLTVINGFQPAIQELWQLGYISRPESGELMLPFDAINPALPKPMLAVSIVLEQASGSGGDGGGGNNGGGNGPGSGSSIATFEEGTGRGRLAVTYKASGELATVFDASCDWVRGSNGFNELHAVKDPDKAPGDHYNTAIYQGTGAEFCGAYRQMTLGGSFRSDWAFYYPAKLKTLYGADCNSIAPAVFIPGVLEFPDSSRFCQSYVQASLAATMIQQLQKFWTSSNTGQSSAATGGTETGSGTGGSNSRTRLRSLVYNPQPYHYSPRATSASLPFGASAQLSAALHATGLKGRLSMPGWQSVDTPAGPAEPPGELYGLQGKLRTANPVQRADGRGGLPGILAAESWHYLDNQTVGSGGETPSTLPPCVPYGKYVCVDGSALPTSAWDFNEQDLTRVKHAQAGTLEVRYQNWQNHSAALPALISPQNSGRPALTVRGDLQMSERSTMAADVVEASVVVAKNLGATHNASFQSKTTVGTPRGGQILGERHAALYVHNGAALRLPRAMPGEPCARENDLEDIALSLPGQLVSNDDGKQVLLDANGRSFHRFMLYCGATKATSPTHPPSGSERNEAVWRNSEYEALSQTYRATHVWRWLEPTYAANGSLTTGSRRDTNEDILIGPNGPWVSGYE
ncbi:hypothetical protein [Roseateles amylovorans]|uniref:Prepilin-type N-terminal cleavage/methylation domain-containing protein n=1 Tax=Roseateles amylovorans TaxID=2978473 RepID=A0ABY6B546_9BURK|nr:hypothetical protein [Roseateles amylovorans]UXH80369.1 hypothetical protein N4261_11030 [Roseateles amylovorans]